MNLRKRKNNSIHHEGRRNFRPRVEEPEVVGSFAGYHDPLARENDSGRPTDTLSIQAYEADVIRGPQAWDRARALEVVTNDYGQAIPGESLVKLGDEDARIWVDRYDARLLLDSNYVSPHISSINQDPGSPTPSASGWSDLPSDSEDMFFLSVEEAEDFTRLKRRKKLDADRAARLKALQDEDKDDPPQSQDVWGDSDEEPPEEQKMLMQRTAAHLASSDNRAQLEMRILANHGADSRMAFLRGRWSRTWSMMCAIAKRELEKKQKPALGLASISAYADSDGGSDEEGTSNAERNVKQEGTTKDILDDEAIKEARRARAREWSAKRRDENASREVYNSLE